jgi:hypothetical protein
MARKKIGKDTNCPKYFERKTNSINGQFEKTIQNPFRLTHHLKKNRIGSSSQKALKFRERFSIPTIKVGAKLQGIVQKQRRKRFTNENKELLYKLIND